MPTILQFYTSLRIASLSLGEVVTPTVFNRLIDKLLGSAVSCMTFSITNGDYAEDVGVPEV